MSVQPRFGIRARLLFSAVLPALLMVSMLGMTFLQRYQADIERSFVERSKAIAQQLGVAADYALFSGSLGALDTLAEGARQSDNDIVSIAVLDVAGNWLAGAGQRPSGHMPLADDIQLIHAGDRVIVKTPIRHAFLPLDGEPWTSDGVPAAAVSGYVVVEISRDQLDRRSNEMLRITLAIVLAGLLLASWISARIAADVLGKLEAARRELAQQKEAAEAMARSDALTGLANRRAFDEAFEREIRRAGRYDTPLSLVMTDIDFFKAINDSHGHHVGDLVLKHFAQTLLSSVRDVDLVGRWGGEEFVVLMPDATLDEARLAAERMRLAVAGAPARCGNVHCGYTASFGVATFSEEASSHDALLGRVDAALYRAKKNGRNRVEVG